MKQTPRQRQQRFRNNAKQLAIFIAIVALSIGSVSFAHMMSLKETTKAEQQATETETSSSLHELYVTQIHEVDEGVCYDLLLPNGEVHHYVAADGPEYYVTVKGNLNDPESLVLVDLP